MDRLSESFGSCSVAFWILVDGVLQHGLIDAALIRIADLAAVDARQNFARSGVVRVRLQQVLRFGGSLFKLTGLHVEVGELLFDIGSAGIQLEGLFVELDGLVDVLAAVAVSARHFAVQVAHGEVVVRGTGVVSRGRRALRQYRRGGGENQNGGEQRGSYVTDHVACSSAPDVKKGHDYSSSLYNVIETFAVAHGSPPRRDRRPNGFGQE